MKLSCENAMLETETNTATSRTDFERRKAFAERRQNMGMVLLKGA
jgi:hypothetical protein